MATVKLVQNNGDKVTWTFKITNNSNIDCFGVSVVFTIPSGVTLTGPLSSNNVSISVPTGSYNPTSTTWFIGSLPANTSTQSVDWEFTVNDISMANELDDSFIITAVVNSRCGDEDSTNNDLELMITVGEECYEIDISVGNPDTSTLDSSNLQITV